MVLQSEDIKRIRSATKKRGEWIKRTRERDKQRQKELNASDQKTREGVS